MFMVGAPGAGKGTQARRLERYGFDHVSVSGLLRHESERSGDAAVAQRIDVGELQGALAVRVVLDRLMCQPADRSLVIDGYFRTVEELESLDVIEEVVKLRLRIMLLRVPRQVCLERVLRRTACVRCRAVGAGATLCTCGGEMLRRPDDNLASWEARMALFEPLEVIVRSRLRGRADYFEVDGNRSPDAVAAEVASALARAAGVGDGAVVDTTS